MKNKYPSTGSTRLYSYVVVGSGNFPLDMLRYDGCWPEDSTALASMTLRHDEVAEPGAFHRALRKVTLRGVHPPTEARWASFRWRCFPSLWEAEDCIKHGN